MTVMNRGQRSALATVRAAQRSRRAVLKGALAAGAVGLAAPGIVRKAFASSGELKWFTWDGYAPQPMVDRFREETGIDLQVTTYASNEDCLNKLKAAGGSGWDMASPSIAWVAAHVDSGNLGAIDVDKLPNLSQVAPSFLNQSGALGAERDGKWYALPWDWGTEALAYNTEEVTLEYGVASYGDIWDEAYKGRMLTRQRSSMICTGLWMERIGELPEGTMMKAYDDPDAFDLGYGKAAQFVIDHKDHILNWWKGSADTQAGFEQDGAIIAECWDGPIFQLKTQGLPYNYLAPVEGALTWIDSVAITSGAENLEQAHHFINWALTPEIGAIFSDETGYSSVVVGFDAYANEAYRKNFADAYPGDAIDKLWVQGTERPWFLERRQALVDKISAA